MLQCVQSKSRQSKTFSSVSTCTLSHRQCEKCWNETYNSQRHTTFQFSYSNITSQMRWFSSWILLLHRYSNPAMGSDFYLVGIDSVLKLHMKRIVMQPLPSRTLMVIQISFSLANCHAFAQNTGEFVNLCCENESLTGTCAAVVIVTPPTYCYAPERLQQSLW